MLVTCVCYLDQVNWDRLCQVSCVDSSMETVIGKRFGVVDKVLLHANFAIVNEPFVHVSQIFLQPAGDRVLSHRTCAQSGLSTYEIRMQRLEVSCVYECMH